ncbi:MAG: TlpA family protein disulfide reductase [Kangiellaceae bacterium]|nr:TlpA family protein disulfide reductase [Kangiellaceae bacterium]
MKLVDNIKNQFKDKPTLRKVISWLFQLVLFVVIFKVASWWQQKDMLPSDESSLAPSFTLPSITGDVINFSTNRTSQQAKQTLLYFFAPWCTVCHYSVGSLQSIKDKSSEEELSIFMIALDWKSKHEVEDFLSKHELDIPVLLGTNKTLKDYKIKGFPSYYLISDSGEIVAKDMGFTTQLGIKSRILLN